MYAILDIADICSSACTGSSSLPAAERTTSDVELGYLRLRQPVAAGRQPFRFVFVDSIVCGALLVLMLAGESTEYLVFDVLDDDMFLRVKRDFPGTTAGKVIHKDDLDLHERAGPDLAEILLDLESVVDVREENEPIGGFLLFFEDDTFDEDDPMANQEDYLPLFEDDSDKQDEDEDEESDGSADFPEFVRGRGRRRQSSSSGGSFDFGSDM